jgi:rhodanese-related sulfurtransferase
MTSPSAVDIEHIHPAQVADWFAVHAGNSVTPVLLDVREVWEVQRAKVAPANCETIHIPMMQLQARISEFDKLLPTAVLCHHGVRSLQVARFFAFNGFSKVANITGGIDAWARDFDANVALY